MLSGMPKISDTSCLILLNKIKELVLLKNLSKTVYNTQPIQGDFGKALPEWIVENSPINGL